MEGFEPFKSLVIQVMKKLRKVGQQALDFIIYGHVFIALCAAFSTLATAKLLNQPNNLSLKDGQLACFVGAATFFLYNLHKPVTYFLRKQFMENQRFKRTKAFEIPLSILSILAAILCVYYFFQLNKNSQMLLMGMAILSLGYVLPILGKGRRLRDIGLLKIFLIAFVWAIITVVLPFLQIHHPSKNDLCLSLLCIERMCFIFALCIPFDIRDMDWDSRTNVKTIPLSIGSEKAKTVGYIALIISLSMSYLLMNLTNYSEMQFLGSAIIYLLTALMLSKTHKNRSDYFFYGGVDGLILGQSLTIILIA